MQNQQLNNNQSLLSAMHFGDQDGLSNGGGQGGFSLNLASASQEAMKRTSAEAGLDAVGLDHDSDSDSGSSSLLREMSAPGGVKPGKKTKGRVKIKMEFIENKLRRYTTFSKRKTGIMKKAYELSTLTGTQVMLLVASETGHVYTFATRKLQPMITSESGKALIQTCLNSPDPPSAAAGLHSIDQRMNPTGFEEPDLSYAVLDEDGSSVEQQMPSAKPVFPTSAAPTPPHSAAHPLMDSPVPSPGSQGSSSNNAPSQANQTISMTAYLPPTNTSNGGSTKASNISMQLPTGGIILPSAGLPPGTPITLNAIQQAALQQSSGQQTIYRIPGGGQVLAIPSMATTSSSGSTNSSTITTTTGSNSGPAQNSSSLAAVQNLTVVAGNTLQQSSSAPPGGTVVYQTPQGMVYASPSTATVNALPDGYLLSLPQTPTFSVTGEQQGQQQFITIPVSLANSQMLQPVLAQTSNEASELLRSLEKRSK